MWRRGERKGGLRQEEGRTGTREKRAEARGQDRYQRCGARSARRAGTRGGRREAGKGK